MAFFLPAAFGATAAAAPAAGAAAGGAAAGTAGAAGLGAAGAQGAAMSGVGLSAAGQGIGASSDFWPQLERTYGGAGGAQGGGASPLGSASDTSEKAQRGARNFGNALQDSLGGIDQRLSNVMYPNRATNQWGPNQNPGLAGLMRQLEGSFRGGYGGGRY